MSAAPSGEAMFEILSGRVMRLRIFNATLGSRAVIAGSLTADGAIETVKIESLSQQTTKTATNGVGIIAGTSAGYIWSVFVNGSGVTITLNAIGPLGGLVGAKTDGQIDVCFVANLTVSNSIGGILTNTLIPTGGMIGYSSGSGYATVVCCRVFNVVVKSTATDNLNSFALGGFIGHLDGGDVSSCSVEGPNGQISSGFGDTGGFVGRVTSGRISDCFVSLPTPMTCGLSGQSAGTLSCGGFAGKVLDPGNIWNSYVAMGIQSMSSAFSTKAVFAAIASPYPGNVFNAVHSTTPATAATDNGFSTGLTNTEISEGTGALSYWDPEIWAFPRLQSQCGVLTSVAQSTPPGITVDIFMPLSLFLRPAEDAYLGYYPLVVPAANQTVGGSNTTSYEIRLADFPDTAAITNATIDFNNKYDYDCIRVSIDVTNMLSTTVMTDRAVWILKPDTQIWEEYDHYADWSGAGCPSAYPLNYGSNPTTAELAVSSGRPNQWSFRLLNFTKIAIACKYGYKEDGLSPAGCVRDSLIPSRSRSKTRTRTRTKMVNSYVCGQPVPDGVTTAGLFSQSNATYPNNYQCSFLIHSTSGCLINAVFRAFHTEQNYDFVTLYDGNSNSASVLLSASGDLLPLPVQSTQPYLLVDFSSDWSITSTGWEIIVSPICSRSQSRTRTKPKETRTRTKPKRTRTRTKTKRTRTRTKPKRTRTRTKTKRTRTRTKTKRTMTKRTRTRTTQRFVCGQAVPFGVTSARLAAVASGNYIANANCTWVFTNIQPGCGVAFTLKSIKSESGGDFLTVANGPATSVVVLMAWSGTMLPAITTVRSTGSSLTVRFVADNDANVGTGFAATVAPYCPVPAVRTTFYMGDAVPAVGFETPLTLRNVASGVVPKSTTTTWTLAHISTFCRPTLTLTSFSSEANGDILTVLSGTTGTLLRWSGSALPPNATTLKSRTSTMTVRFATNAAVMSAGFVATVGSVCTPDCAPQTFYLGDSIPANMYESVLKVVEAGTYWGNINTTWTYTRTDPGCFFTGATSTQRGRTHAQTPGASC
eukprot:TRINITY_DN6344_c0_g1_i9.p1 TRINITY_DN6344_c0_g1~~TRINITY_DN6344_c0_g1_i9.p1  ORF type:complete len:1054 (-),score=190.77 TRINITY_DN6344_c0_g1_i9:291-3413(-)